MTNTQHTPGPWAIYGVDPVLGKFIIHNGATDIAVTYWALGDCAANARLIAAAPEMLAALIDAEDTMFRALESHKFDSPADSAAVIDTLVIVRAAIANALDQI